MKKFGIPATVILTVTPGHIEQFLSSAIHGGSTYWVDSMYVVGEGSDDYDGYAEDSLTAGFSLECTIHDPDNEDRGRQTIILSWDVAVEACQKFATAHPEIFGECIANAGNIDATRGDMWLQFALLGDEIYA